MKPRRIIPLVLRNTMVRTSTRSPSESALGGHSDQFARISPPTMGPGEESSAAMGCVALQDEVRGGMRYRMRQRPCRKSRQREQGMLCGDARGMPSRLAPMGR